jgi:hypothetical protein
MPGPGIRKVARNRPADQLRRQHPKISYVVVGRQLRSRSLIDVLARVCASTRLTITAQ